MNVDPRSPWGLWCSAPWYDKLGMSVFLGIHAAAVVAALIDFATR